MIYSETKAFQHFIVDLIILWIPYIKELKENIWDKKSCFKKKYVSLRIKQSPSKSFRK